MANKPTDLQAMRHSLAHIMASAVQKIWPKAQFGVGPVVEDGFYYDIHVPETTISEDDFGKIEKEMQSTVAANDYFEQFDMAIDEAIEWAKQADQPMKLELLNDLKRDGTTAASEIDAEQLGVASDKKQVDTVSFYKHGDFQDLCRGPHVASTGLVGAFKLIKVAGAYWRGDESKQQLQRLYGVAFISPKELDDYLKNQEEAKVRDHRRLGQELDLFTLSDLVGSGLPMFTPNGTWLRELLGRYSQQLRADLGFQRVWTPHITKNELYKMSGHWEKFGDELFLVKSQESSDEFVMKPMNCPHHIQIYNARPRSYRDLPIKYMEIATDYRDEKSGELHGLSRVRALTQDDSHVFATLEQVEEVVTELVHAAKELYGELEMDLRFSLSFRDDTDAYLGDPKLWDKPQAILKQLAAKNKLDYTIEEGEAAFYGPKIDYIAIDALNREWQVATVQLDLFMPQRFELQYTDSNGEMQTPVMVHCALLGSIERFLSVYIEHTAGHFPFWLAPEQVRVLLVNDNVESYARTVEKVLSEVIIQAPLKHNELRYSVDRRNLSLGKKIREAETMKIPLMVIIGPKDESASLLSLRSQKGEETIALGKFAEYLQSL